MSWTAKGQGDGLWAERGDTFFTKSESLLGRLIRWGETEKGETNGTWTNHTGVVVESGWLVPPEFGGRLEDIAAGRVSVLPTDPRPVDQLAVIVEAMWHVQRGAWWDLHAKDYAKGQRIRAFYPIPAYTEEEKQRFVTFANHGIGERYGWWKLLGFLAKRATGIDIPKYFFLKDRPICSYYAAYTNEEARKRGSVMTEPGRYVWPWPGFGMAPQAADPDEMMDFCLEHTEYWRERRPHRPCLGGGR